MAYRKVLGNWEVLGDKSLEREAMWGSGNIQGNPSEYHVKGRNGMVTSAEPVTEWNGVYGMEYMEWILACITALEW